MQIHKGLRQEILSDIETIAKDEKLFREKNFILRAQAMDDIEFHVIERIQSFGEITDSLDHLNDLIRYAEKVRAELEEVNAKMFQKIRAGIALGDYREIALIKLLSEYLDQPSDSDLPHYEAGYDYHDLFLNGLLTYQELPVETSEREPGMIYYQKTPARIIFELIKRAALQSGDVFYDLGSGPGQVTMLVNLLTSVVSKGVEFEPAFCSYAKALATELNLSQADFINEDARRADYSAGNVFFMYTPFEGQMLIDVLSNLQNEAKKKRIRIFTYGSCTPEVGRQPWLRQINKTQNYLAELAEFVSI